jgi:tRNA pseudouridine65 synthase
VSDCPIIYRDRDLVAVNKPSGLLVHRSQIDRRETRFALQQVRDAVGQHVYPVHRLDKPTSGVLLFALSPEAARALSAQFSSGQVTKRYLAVVRGHAPATGDIDYPLAAKPDRIADRGRSPDRDPQTALTRFRCLAQVEIPVAVDRYPTTRYSLMELLPKTGRRHQLRRHMKHIGHPIIGDAKHGKGVHNRFFQRAYGCHRLLLACTDLAITHPAGGNTLEFHAPLDASFDCILDVFGWTDFTWEPAPRAIGRSCIVR